MTDDSLTTEELIALLKMAMAENVQMKEANKRLEMQLKSAERTVGKLSKESERRKRLFEAADKRRRSVEDKLKYAGKDIEIF